jgi:hypothetical protein
VLNFIYFKANANIARLRDFFKKNVVLPRSIFIFFSTDFCATGVVPHARGVYDQIFSKKPKNWRHTWQKR